jgi:UBX domain-containing protein 7
MSDSDELVSQFMAFSGCGDPERAQSYLEMSGNNLEMAISLYMDHSGGAIGTAGTDGDAVAASEFAGMADIRAPDATQRMRLMDVGPPGYDMLMADPEPEQMIIPNAFAATTDIRAAINAAALAANSDEDGGDDDDDDIQVLVPTLRGLQDMFSPPTHLMHTAGGFQGARSMAKDTRRWLLVNIQRDAEFSSHALNRDVWRDDLVENLIREGFMFWQTVSWFNVRERR